MILILSFMSLTCLGKFRVEFLTWLVKSIKTNEYFWLDSFNSFSPTDGLEKIVASNPFSTRAALNLRPKTESSQIIITVGFVEIVKYLFV